jgi:hypothetical protein
MVTVRGQNQITLPVLVLQPLKAKTYYLVRTNGTAYIGMQGALHYKDIYQKYYKDLHCKCLQVFTGTLRGNRSAGISNLWGLYVTSDALKFVPKTVVKHY